MRRCIVGILDIVIEWIRGPVIGVADFEMEVRRSDAGLARPGDEIAAFDRQPARAGIDVLIIPLRFYLLVAQ